jgi:hypothetical protein
MTQDTREDFHRWQIDLAYEEAQGLCHRCGANLDQGYHIHHVNSDHSDNTLINMELLCVKCHFTTYRGSNPWDEHKKTEAKVLESLLKVIDLVLDPASKMSGATIEKLNDSMTMALRSSRYLNEIDYGKLSVPTSILQMRGASESKALGEQYMMGYMEGVKATVSKLGVKTEG